MDMRHALHIKDLHWFGQTINISIWLILDLDTFDAFYGEKTKNADKAVEIPSSKIFDTNK